jgi:hypothetical protein
MNTMNIAWTVLKQNVATANVQYGSHMPEIKPHPAAVSYAQRSGYQPDGKAYPNVNDAGVKSNTSTQQTPNAEHPMGGNTQGALPGRKIELMPRPNAGINSEPNYQNMGISPQTGRQMDDEAYAMDYNSKGRQNNSANADKVTAALNTKQGRVGRRDAGGHYPGPEGQEHADKILGPVGSANPRSNLSQTQGDLDHLDRLPMNEEEARGLENSRMNQRHVKPTSSHRRKLGTEVHDADGRRLPNAPVRDFDKPQETQNLVATGYPMAMNHAWSIVKQKAKCCPKCEPKGSTCEKEGCNS